MNHRNSYIKVTRIDLINKKYFTEFGFFVVIVFFTWWLMSYFSESFGQNNDYGYNQGYYDYDYGYGQESSDNNYDNSDYENGNNDSYGNYSNEGDNTSNYNNSQYYGGDNSNNQYLDGDQNLNYQTIENQQYQSNYNNQVYQQKNSNNYYDNLSSPPQSQQRPNSQLASDYQQDSQKNYQNYQNIDADNFSDLGLIIEEDVNYSSEYNQSANNKNTLNFLNTEKLNSTRADGIDIDPGRLKTVALPNEFSGALPSEGGLGYLTIGQAPNYYIIQDGDTLYDICDQLLDDPVYWPKLWSLNPTIINPHFIWPGMVLRFYPGDDNHPPFLEIEQEQSFTPVDIRGEHITEDLVKAPMFEQIESLTAENVWPQYVEIDQIPEIEDDYITTIDPISYIKLRSTRNSLVYPSRPKVLGRVIGNLHGEYEIKKNGVLKAKQTLQQGKIYSVIRYFDKVRNPYNSVQILGFQYFNIGTIKILSYDSKTKKAIFKLDQVYSIVDQNDLVVELKNNTHEIPNIDPKVTKGDQVDATVVGFDAPGASIAKKGDYIFVSNTRGLSQGDKISLYKKRLVSGKFVRELNEFLYYGAAYVVETADKLAVAYVYNSNSEIKVGDRSKPENPSSSLFFSKVK